MQLGLNGDLGLVSTFAAAALGGRGRIWGWWRRSGTLLQLKVCRVPLHADLHLMFLSAHKNSGTSGDPVLPTELPVGIFLWQKLNIGSRHKQHQKAVQPSILLCFVWVPWQWIKWLDRTSSRRKGMFFFSTKISLLNIKRTAGTFLFAGKILFLFHTELISQLCEFLLSNALANCRKDHVLALPGLSPTRNAIWGLLQGCKGFL